VQHREYAALYPAFQVAYTKLVTITTDTLEEANAMRERTGAEWPFLCDPERVVQRDLDIQEYTDPRHDPMLPYSFILEPQRVIYKIYNGYWFWGRPSPEDLRHDLRAVFQKVRPDWDPTTPGLRENWDGDRTLHYPYRSRE
jgi:peroxiredoxin